MPNPHPHAPLMALYAQDALETSRPWERWQFSSTHFEMWVGCGSHPEWSTDVRYRRKPRVRSLHGFEYPEPESKAPTEGTEYWVPRVTGPRAYAGLALTYNWEDHNIDRRFLRHGMVHLSKEAAEAHARAIIKAGGGDV